MVLRGSLILPLKKGLGSKFTTAGPIPDSTLDVLCDLEYFIEALWHWAASVKLGQYHCNTVSAHSWVAWHSYYNLVSTSNGMEALLNTE